MIGRDWDSMWGFRQLGCPEPRCLLTSNRSALPPRQFSAVVFHQRSVQSGDLPPPVSRDPSQLYIHLSMEAPAWARHDRTQPSSLAHFYNLSLSYRRDADLTAPYGRLVQVRPLPAPLQRFIQQFGEEAAGRVAGRRTGRPPRAAQFVSNCASESGREEVVRSLQKHFPVDVWGECGTRQCPRADATQCYEKMAASHHFYLSLENAVCRDYVTEKFFNILQFNVIPVVLNGANMSAVAPPHSYIDVRDFPSTKALAAELRRVAADPALFASYFWWRDFYRVEAWPGTLGRALCQLCTRLHSARPPSGVIADLQQFWADQGRCTNPPFLQL